MTDDLLTVDETLLAISREYVPPKPKTDDICFACEGEREWGGEEPCEHWHEAFMRRGGEQP